MSRTSPPSQPFAALPARMLVALLVSMCMASVPARVAAQQPDSTAALDTRRLPADIAQRASELHASAVIRSTTRLHIESGRVVQGGISIRNGPLVIAGHVEGSVLAIDADVQLVPGARVDGDLLVVGGEVTGLDSALVGGEMRQYRASSRPGQRERVVEGERVRGPDEESDHWWGRWERRTRGNTWSDFHFSTAGPYNRVEGLPVKLGPRVRQEIGGSQLMVDAFAVVRTASSFRNDSSDVGYDLLGEVRWGRRLGFALGGRAFDINAAVEEWQLSELEVGLASFLARRDYRDYYGRHGGQLIARAYTGPNVSLQVTFGDERWSARREENPFSLFNSDRPWRPNPLMDEGRFHVLNAGVLVDTRNDEDDPWAGWYVMADVERGTGRTTLLTIVPAEVRVAQAGGDPKTYGRGLVDLRRYNRLGPNAQLNLRMVVGGWLGGDALPLQRRLSVDGPGALPGFGFRREREGFDIGTCNVSSQRLPGQPALCERIALVQVEYRGDIHVSSIADWGWINLNGDAEWTMFADAGRGWLLRDSEGGAGYGTGELPPLDSFRADVGFGIDFRQLGVYVAKAVTAGSEPPVMFVRVRHRF